jgi:hypothetical protein
MGRDSRDQPADPPEGFSLMRLRGGKIVQLSSYYDTGTLNRQLGL